MKADRLQQVFARCRSEHRAALVAYMTAGLPDVQRSASCLECLAQCADILEIGMPFSDPMADGPVIQAASEQALAAGCTMRDVFALTRSVRDAHPDIGIVLMGYANTAYCMGFLRFAEAAAAAGADAVLLVDIPPEESASCRDALRQHGLKQIFLLAPTTPEARARRIFEMAEGFVYYVALKGVTGADIESIGELRRHVESLRQYGEIPLCVGFGIKEPAQARDIAAFADGVVIGSAFVRAVTENPEHFHQAIDALGAMARAARSAMKREET